MYGYKAAYVMGMDGGWMGGWVLKLFFGMENIRIDESQGDAGSNWREESDYQQESEGQNGEMMPAEEEEALQCIQDILDIPHGDVLRQAQRLPQQPLKTSEELLPSTQAVSNTNFPSPLSDQDDTQSEYTYEQLSHQLERALCKIKSKESVKSQSFLDRVDYFQKKKHSALEQRKQEKELQASKLTSKQPTTNAHSQRLLTHYEPIQERSAKIIEEKKKRLQRHQMEKRMKEQEAVQQELQMANQPKKSDIRSKQEFLSSMASWNEQKQRKIDAMASKGMQSEMAGVTFQPQINLHSKVMVQRSGKVPIQQRAVKPKKMQLDQECTFRPNINKLKI